MTETLRLNRYLAAAGVGSRRHCDELIRAGRIRVNEAAASELGTKVDPSRDAVFVDGVRVEMAREVHTLALHKPPDVLVAARDGRGRRTVMDLVGEGPGRVFPVGRLDYRSEGLLLMTNDGELAFRLAHPRFKVEKVYEVEVAGDVPDRVLDGLRTGVVLEDGPTQPAQVKVLRRETGKTALEVRLREGRKRQIRRMIALFGLLVLRLVRVRFGPVALGSLPSGKWRPLDAGEIEELRKAVGLAAPGAGDPS
jgi:pseudouridine synthase